MGCVIGLPNGLRCDLSIFNALLTSFPRARPRNRSSRLCSGGVSATIATVVQTIFLLPATTAAAAPLLRERYAGSVLPPTNARAPRQAATSVLSPCSRPIEQNF